MSGDVAPGLQRERTQLAWQRVSLGLLANGALLLLHDLDRSADPALLVPGAVAVVLALLTDLIGQRRARAIEVSGRAARPAAAGTAASVPAPSRAVSALGWSVCALALLTLWAIVPWP